MSTNQHPGYNGATTINPPENSTSNSELTTTYLCGECNSKVVLARGDPIRCKECGHRVLYKMRTTRMVQFEAR